MDLEVVVLAAGAGTRMRSHWPKVLHTLGGRPILAHVLEAAQALEPSAIRVVIGHGAESVREAFAYAPVAFVEQPEQVGTGDAVRRAGPDFARSDWVMVLNGDVPLLCGETLQRWWGSLGESRAGLVLLTAHLDDPSGYGRILRESAGGIAGIREEKDASAAERGIGEVFTGILAARGPRLGPWLERLSDDNAQGEYYLTDIVAMAADEAGVAGFPLPDPAEALGINDRAQLAVAEAAFQRRAAQALMAGGVTLRDPARTAVYGTVHPAPDAVVDPGCQFEGEVELAEDVHIGPGCYLRDTRLGSGARIHGHSHLDGADVGPGAEVGPFARLRGESVLEEGARVGNFVETKKARLGKGVKANHLTYVGDAEVGPGANLGAGTITCNYDGHRKHKTTIGAGAFIGSAVQLVAPVTVGEGATIGAGSTISRDAPAHALTVCRSRQFTRSDWKRPEDREHRADHDQESGDRESEDRESGDKD